MSVHERLEAAELIESTVDHSQLEMTVEQKATIRSRAEELQADPSVGLARDELAGQRGSRRA